ERNRSIFRTRARTIRRAGQITSIGELFSKDIGCAFVDNNKEMFEAIDKYVSNFAYNIVFLLRLLSSSPCDDEETTEKIKILCTILGYGSESKISLLARLITHDYRSLQWS
ncbi:MAG: hypothetical protein HQK51_13575, partial [Oligoflexia bacterium]|nr:hypothetical protein [Oligoflexia bacterium]